MRWTNLYLIISGQRKRILNSFVRIVHTICARTIIILWIAYFVKDVLKEQTVMLYLVKSFLRALWNLKHNRRLFDSFLLSLSSTLKKKALSKYICCGTAHNFQSRACKKFTVIKKLLSEWRATTTRFDFDFWFLILLPEAGLLNRGQ